MTDETPSRSCPHCQGRDLYVANVASGTVDGPQFLPGLGSLLGYAEFDIIVCAGCGFTQLFVPADEMISRAI